MAEIDIGAQIKGITERAVKYSDGANMQTLYIRDVSMEVVGMPPQVLPVPSFVLEAMGLSPDWSIGGLRLTLGRVNDEADVTRVLEVLPGIVKRLRADERGMVSRASSCGSKRRCG